MEELKVLLNDEPIYFTSNHIVMADSHLILKTQGNPFNVYHDDLVVTKIFK